MAHSPGHALRGRSTQVHAKLELLTSAGMKMEAFRSARVYDLWGLAELAQDDACRAEIMKADFVPHLVMLLQDEEVPSMPAAAAVLIRRICANSPGNGRELTNSGKCSHSCTDMHVCASLTGAQEPAMLLLSSYDGIVLPCCSV